jgi:hypothetical protein
MSSTNKHSWMAWNGFESQSAICIICKTKRLRKEKSESKYLYVDTSGNEFIHAPSCKTINSNNMFTDQIKIDLLVTALEGGSNYWYWIEDNSMVKDADGHKPFVDRMWEAIQTGASIPINDIENPGEILGYISKESLIDGEKLIEEKYPIVYQNCVDENYDANDADIFLQLVVMGEVTFG